MPGGSERLDLAVPEEFGVRISWELPDQPLPLGVLQTVGVQRAGQALLLQRCPDRPLPVQLL